MWTIDPKGGIALGRARAWFARFYGGELEAVAELLEGRQTAAVGPDVVGLAARSG